MRRSFILCLVLLTLALPAAARQLALDPSATDTGPSLRVQERSEEKLILEFTLPALELEEFSVEGERYQALGIPGGGMRGAEGQPGLPTYSRLMALPEGVQARVSILGRSEQRIAGQRILPVQPPDARDFVIDRAFYGGADRAAVTPVELGQAAYIRGLRVVPLMISPVNWDPASGELEVIERLELEISFEGADSESAPRFLPESFDNLYRDIVFNYERSEETEVGPGTYLLICRDNTEVLSRIEPLLDWRRRQGYAVQLATTTQTGSTNSSIKNYIQGVYDTADPPLEYVALLGDTSGDHPIPHWTENLSGYSGPGDHYYTNLEGGDVLADVHIGRLSTRTNTDIEIVVNKILTYETDPPTSDPGWFTRAGLAGDPGASGITTIYVNQWLKQQLLAHDYSQVDTLWNPNSSNMMSSINQGLTVFGYRGWLGMSGLSESGILNLSNGDELPYAIIVTCDTGTFSSTTCRSEAFFRAPNGGGIGSVGTATSGTHTRYNNCYYQGAWEGAVNGSDHRLGFSHTRGKIELYNQYQISQPNTVEIWCMWNNLMGDPATQLRMAYPDPLLVEHPAQLAVGANAVPVTVTKNGSPVEGARVALYKENEIRTVAYTDFYGEALLPISGYFSGELLVTATDFNTKPYQGSITLGVMDLFVAYSSSTVDDDLSGDSSGNGDGIVNPGESIELPLALRNFGGNTALNVTANLNSEDSYLVISDDFESFGNIPPGGVVWSAEDYDFQVAADAPDGHVLSCELQAQGNLESWISLVELTVVSAAFSMEDYTWGGPGGTLDPGESGSLSIEIRNTGSLNANGITAILESEDPWIAISDAAGSYGNLNIGASGENTGNPFAVDISPDCFQGHLASFTLILSFNGGYLDPLEFNLPVGSVDSDDPVGPDGYGYYAFDNTDTSYPYFPGYNWIEIDPNHGGSGTDLGLGDFGWEQDDTETVPLPFVFTYYGEPYTEVSICSNGWVAMGETSLKPYRNWSIPSAGSPNAMIAAFWDNLYQTGTNKVYTWNDTENGRYVVQWSRVRNDWSNATQNFELILYDPVLYPTSTGDGQIVVQYETVNNTDTQNGYGTVGIQNKDRTDGLLYTYWNQYAPGAPSLSSGRAIRFMPVAQLNLGQLQGTVLNASNSNAPAAGVNVRLVESGQTFISSADGNYYGGVHEGVYTVVTQHESFETEEVEDVEIIEGEITELNFLLSDILGPYIVDTTVLPHTDDTSGPYIVDTWINDFSNIAEIRFDYAGAGGMGQLPLTLIDAETGHYQVDIPGQPINTQVRYWITARDVGGNSNRDPVGGDTYMFWVVEGAQFADDDMESGLGWIVGDTGDDATTGVWVRVDPIGVFDDGQWAQPEDDASTDGTLCFITGNNEDGNPGTDDVDNGKTTLLSPWFDLSGLMSAQLNYMRWYVNDTGYNPGEDYWVVEATGNGVDWVSLEYTNGSIHDWVQRSFSLEDYLELTSTMRFRFIASDFGQGSYVEAGVDEFQLYGFETPDATSLPDEALPERLTLLGAAPNPFNPVTEIRFALPAAEKVSLKIYDAAGRLVRTLLNEHSVAAGYHAMTWNGLDERGVAASSGIYLYRLSTEEEKLSAKMTLLK